MINVITMAFCQQSHAATNSNVPNVKQNGLTKISKLQEILNFFQKSIQKSMNMYGPNHVLNVEYKSKKMEAVHTCIVRNVDMIIVGFAIKIITNTIPSFA